MWSLNGNFNGDLNVSTVYSTDFKKCHLVSNKGNLVIRVLDNWCTYILSIYLNTFISYRFIIYPNTGKIFVLIVQTFVLAGIRNHDH